MSAYDIIDICNTFCNQSVSALPTTVVYKHDITEVFIAKFIDEACDPHHQHHSINKLHALQRVGSRPDTPLSRVSRSEHLNRLPSSRASGRRRSPPTSDLSMLPAKRIAVLKAAEHLSVLLPTFETGRRADNRASNEAARLLPTPGEPVDANSSAGRQNTRA